MSADVHMRFDATTPPTLFVVLADPAEEDLEEFRHWYDEVHGPDALGNGSFVALNRFAACGGGHRAAPFLAFWEGQFANEADAWAYIRPRAKALRAAGRAGDIASVAFAIMLVRSSHRGSSKPTEPVRSLVTVQNDWRDPAGATSVERWWRTAGLDEAPASRSQWLVTSDPDGRGPGFHLAAFASSDPPEVTMKAWAGIGMPGTSPVAPYTNMFGVTAPPHPDEPDHATAWVMHWTPVASQRVLTRDA